MIFKIFTPKSSAKIPAFWNEITVMQLCRKSNRSIGLKENNIYSLKKLVKICCTGTRNVGGDEPISDSHRCLRESLYLVGNVLAVPAGSREIGMACKMPFWSRFYESTSAGI
jgi:hypothetical protein